MTGITAYWRIDTPTNPSAMLAANQRQRERPPPERDRGGGERQHLERERRDVGHERRASGPHSGPTAIVAATNTAHHARPHASAGR